MEDIYGLPDRKCLPESRYLPNLLVIEAAERQTSTVPYGETGSQWE